MLGDFDQRLLLRQKARAAIEARRAPLGSGIVGIFGAVSGSVCFEIELLVVARSLKYDGTRPRGLEERVRMP